MQTVAVGKWLVQAHPGTAVLQLRSGRQELPAHTWSCCYPTSPNTMDKPPLLQEGLRCSTRNAEEDDPGSV